MNPHTPSLNRRRLLCGCAGLAGLAALSLAGCGQDNAASSQAQGPVDFQAQSSCALDGMLLADYPGPKGQARFGDAAEVQWFCDTTELLSTLIAPEQVRTVVNAYVQDMAQADWDQPHGHWTDARQALYVFGSQRKGSMGPTAVSFATETGAQAFVKRYGGRVLRFAEIQPEMVDLSGGAMRDTRM